MLPLVWDASTLRFVLPKLTYNTSITIACLNGKLHAYVYDRLVQSSMKASISKDVLLIKHTSLSLYSWLCVYNLVSTVKML